MPVDPAPIVLGELTISQRNCGRKMRLQKINIISLRPPLPTRNTQTKTTIDKLEINLPVPLSIVILRSINYA